METGVGTSDCAQSFGPYEFEIWAGPGKDDWVRVRRLGFYVPDFSANILSIFRDRRLFGTSVTSTQQGGVTNDTLHIDGVSIPLDTSRDISKGLIDFTACWS